MALLAVKVQIVAEPLACNMQHLCPAAGDVCTIEVEKTEAYNVRTSKGGPPMVRVDQV
jgi:hypothetical protein